MASIREVIKKGMTAKEAKEESSEPAINEMVEKVFCTRNLVHFAHLTTGSFASHMALGELYDSIVDEVDDIAETYIGEFGPLKNLECDCCKQPDDIIVHLKEEFAWIKANRTKIANGSTVIENLIDGLSAKYSKALYKLQNLH